jgi:hypothetical protein
MALEEASRGERLCGRCLIEGLGFRGSGLGVRVENLGFRGVEDLGFRGEGLGVRG